jgi:hypothetical protein
VDPLYVIAVISNPVRYASRYRLYHDFAARMRREPNVILYTVEIAYGDRPHVLTHPDGNQIALRTKYELWHKENMGNLGVMRLPDEAKNIAFIDADVSFARHDWAEETVQQLQHHPVVQMFSHSVDLGPNHEPILQRESFASAYVAGKNMLPPSRQTPAYKSGNFHPGYAWAYRRDFLDQVGGLMDFAIVGSADYHMAYSMIGRGGETAPRNISAEYADLILAWQDRCERSMRRNLGVVSGTLTHYWHGKKVDRKYADRWKILFEHEFNPVTDIVRDSHGVLRLSGNKPELRRSLMGYFRARNEDSIDNE